MTELAKSKKTNKQKTDNQPTTNPTTNPTNKHRNYFYIEPADLILARSQLIAVRNCNSIVLCWNCVFIRWYVARILAKNSYTNKPWWICPHLVDMNIARLHLFSGCLHEHVLLEFLYSVDMNFAGILHCSGWLHGHL